ncbi:hypothetical protein [Bacteroides sp.]
MMKKILCLLAIALPVLLSSCSNDEGTIPEFEYPMSNGNIWLPEDGSLGDKIYFSDNFIHYKTCNVDSEKVEDNGVRSCKYTYSHPNIWLNLSEGLLGHEKYVAEGEFLKGIETITVDSSKLTVKMFSGEVRVFVPMYKR